MITFMDEISVKEHIGERFNDQSIFEIVKLSMCTLFLMPPAKDSDGTNSSKTTVEENFTNFKIAWLSQPSDRENYKTRQSALKLT